LPDRLSLQSHHNAVARDLLRLPLSGTVVDDQRG
jgi:hypothetical protein